MAAIIAGLLIIIGIKDPGWRQALAADFRDRLPVKIFIGLAAAAGLYLVFWIGNLLARQLFPFAEMGISGVYAYKGQASAIRIAVLMLAVIGPGEELFWRGYLQHRWQVEISPVKGYLLATLIYTAVHLGSANIMLVLAAAVCGLFWGFLYYRFRSITINVVSHTVWDIAVFLLFPFA